MRRTRLVSMIGSAMAIVRSLFAEAKMPVTGYAFQAARAI